MPSKQMSEKQYMTNMLLYGPKRAPSSDDMLKYMAKSLIKEPWLEGCTDDDYDEEGFQEWLREQWMYSLMLYKPTEAKKLTDRFPFLGEYAYMTGTKEVDEFTYFVDMNLAIPNSTQSFSLSVNHTSNSKFVEKTIKHFFSAGMAELINDKWKGEQILDSEFTPSVVRFVLFRGVAAECQKSSSIVASEVKLARIMHRQGIDIKMDASELRAFCKTTVARELFWLIVCMYVTFEKCFDRCEQEEWGDWFETAMQTCISDEDVQRFREYVIDCEDQCYCHNTMMDKSNAARITRINVKLNVIAWKEEKAIGELQVEFEAKQREGDRMAARKINGMINDRKQYRDSALCVKNEETVVRFHKGVYVPPQVTGGTQALVYIQDHEALEPSLIDKLDYMESFIEIGNWIMDEQLRTVGDLMMECDDLRNLSESHAQKKKEEERLRSEIIAQNGIAIVSREDALAFIEQRCRLVSLAAPAHGFMFDAPSVNDPRALLDHHLMRQGNADFSDLLDDGEAAAGNASVQPNVEAVNAAVEATMSRIVLEVETEALGMDAANIAMDNAVEIAMDEALLELQSDDAINQTVQIAFDRVLHDVMIDIEEASIEERIKHRRSVRNAVKSFNRLKDSVVEEIQTMHIEFAMYRDKVEQHRKKTEILKLMSEIRCIAAEILPMMRFEVLAFMDEVNDVLTDGLTEVSEGLKSTTSKNKKVMFTLAAYRLFPKYFLGVVQCGQCDSPVDMGQDAAFNSRSGSFSCNYCILTNHSERMQLEYRITHLIKSVRKELHVPECGFDLQDSGNALSRFPVGYTKRIFLATAPQFVPLAMYSDEVQCSMCLGQIEWGVDKGIGFVTCCPEFGFLCGCCIKSPNAHTKDHQSFAVDYEITRATAEVRRKVGI